MLGDNYRNTSCNPLELKMRPMRMPLVSMFVDFGPLGAQG
jgi:hypothetical protein